MSESWSSSYEVIVPEGLFHPTFFSDQKVIFHKKVSFNDTLDIPFYHDLLYYNSLSNTKELPWYNELETIPLIFRKWDLLREDIKEFFQKRDRTRALEPMKLSIALFMDALYWSGNIPVRNILEWNKEINQLSVRLLNLEDRLSYILQSPNHYHSFIQLEQLFNEYEKKFTIYKINKKMELSD